MHLWFVASIAGVIGVLPLYFLSLEHWKLQQRFGAKKGRLIGEICGFVSGWGFFLFWVGIWVSPQPRFTIPATSNLSTHFSIAGIPVYLHNIIFSAPFIATGSWLGIKGVKDIGLKLAETHRAQTIVTLGSYSFVRHPQHLGGLLAHIGISILLSASFSTLFTPVMVMLVFLISKKEEEELKREFGEEYENYVNEVPMLIPRLRRRRRKLE